MAIYRGNGGAGDATNDITINQITELSSEAQISADAAASSATSASSSASAATTSATNAANSATSAGTSATNAASSASSASTSASNASTSETNAAASETAAAASEAAAALSETAAAVSETNAASSASSASTSASTATTQATSAATSATNAATSASAASTSETNAATSETNAATSETNAASSATSASTDAATATTKASEASTSASNAATSETNAAASESAAATSATNASTSETNAAASETAAASSASAAATSETNAATSASGAATSASSAATSASNASASADAALSALDNFDDRYLGQKTSDPTTDNDGDALVAGALYFNTTDDAMKVYEGSTWVAAYASLAGALLASNNLSDLDNVSTARTNLGLGTAATTASTDYATAAQGALADSALQSIPDNYILNTGDSITGDLSFGDSDKAIFGAGSDLQIYHDGSNSYVRDAGTGNLIVRGTNLQLRGNTTNELFMNCVENGAVNLYFDNAAKLATTSTGVNVTGTVTATGGNSTNWNTAYGWGDHSAVGYLTAATGTDTDLSNLSATGERRVCHIYCKWNGTGTVTILDSNNVSSITDNGTGQYTLNFSITMANSNYAFVTSSSRTSGQSAMGNLGFTDGTTNTTTALSLNNRGASSNRDNANLSVAIFGD